MRHKSLALLITLLSVVGAARAEQSAKFALCEVNSDCKACIERTSFVFTPNPGTRSVGLRGKNNVGVPFDHTLGDCKFENATTWACTDGQNLWAAEDGKIRLVKSRTVEVNGVQYKACVSNEQR